MMRLLSLNGRRGPFRCWYQGSEDPFLKEQLKPELLVSACHSAGMNLGFNQREGYDHGYLFVSSFMENHLRFHHGILSMVV